MEKKVAIVGAGVSGLLACKYTLSKGFKPIVFEAKSKIGGVWIKTIETTKLQTPKPLYQFSDFPWPDSVTEVFPDQFQVHDYIQSYANHFDLLKHIKFNTKVLGISFEGPSNEEMESWSLWGGNGEAFSSKGKWNIEVLDTQSLATEIYQVEFVILCMGKFSDVPNNPEFPVGKGPEAFQGQVIHAKDYMNMDFETARNFLKGKRLAVCGFQKFAQDIAMECAAANGVENPCRLMYRKAHWTIPDFLPWGIPLTYLYLNRFAELLVHKPGDGFLLQLLATSLAPLRWAICKFVESDVKNKLPMEKFGMVPKHDFIQQWSSCVLAIVPQNFYEKVEEGSIILTEAPKFSFCKEYIRVENPCRLMYKTAHWNVPDYLPWGIPLTYLYLNRFAELLVHKPGEGFLLKLLATFLAPLRWAISKFVESHIKNKLPLEKFGMVPDHDFIQQLNSCLVSTVPEKFYEKVEEGSIILTKVPKFSFCKEGIIIDGQTQPLEVDLVILATGFKGEEKLKDIFVSKKFQECLVGSSIAALPLYRECISPGIPQLAVVGFSESVSNLYTSEIRCRWLAELLDGKFKIPSIKQMEKDIANWDKYFKRYGGPYYRRSCIAALHIWYNDQLCKDMGWNPNRKKGFFAELFEPYGPLDYVSSSST